MKADRISFKVVQDPNGARRDGKICLKLRVTFKMVRKYYATQYNLTEKKWLELNELNVRGRLRTIKNDLSKIEIDAEKIASHIIPFSFKIFESNFFIKSSIHFTLQDLFESKIKSLIDNGQIGTATSYKAAIVSLLKFKQNLVIEDVSVSFLQEYEKWMLELNKSKASIGIYLRGLRCILNIAIEEKLLNKENYPFGNRKYKIPIGQNIKKALDLPTIKKIFEYKTIDGTNMGMAKDFWIFSYLCNGINIKDIAFLKWKNLTIETIIFERQKTKNTYRGNNSKIVALRNNIINEIIDKWCNKIMLPEDYVFNVINKGNNPETIQKKVQQFIKTINNWMKRIGRDLGLELELTTYVARHSFATILVQNGVPLEFASQSLGHTNITTTQRYFAGFDLKAQKEFTKVLTNF